MENDFVETLEELRDIYIDQTLGINEVEEFEETQESKESDEPEKPWSQIKDDRYRPEIVLKVESLQQKKQSEDSKFQKMSKEDKTTYLFNKAKDSRDSNDWTQVIKNLI